MFGGAGGILGWARFPSLYRLGYRLPRLWRWWANFWRASGAWGEKRVQPRENGIQGLLYCLGQTSCRKLGMCGFPYKVLRTA